MRNVLKELRFTINLMLSIFKSYHLFFIEMQGPWTLDQGTIF